MHQLLNVILTIDKVYTALQRAPGCGPGLLDTYTEAKDNYGFQ